MNPTKCYKEIYFLFFLLLTSFPALAQSAGTDTSTMRVIGDVRVEGNHRTRSGIILREMAIKTGGHSFC
jgi:hypothetical protein